MAFIELHDTRIKSFLKQGDIVEIIFNPAPWFEDASDAQNPTKDRWVSAKLEIADVHKIEYITKQDEEDIWGGNISIEEETFEDLVPFPLLHENASVNLEFKLAEGGSLKIRGKGFMLVDANQIVEGV